MLKKAMLFLLMIPLQSEKKWEKKQGFRSFAPNAIECLMG